MRFVRHFHGAIFGSMVESEVWKMLERLPMVLDVNLMDEMERLQGLPTKVQIVRPQIMVLPAKHAISRTDPALHHHLICRQVT